MLGRFSTRRRKRKNTHTKHLAAKTTRRLQRPSRTSAGTRAITKSKYGNCERRDKTGRGGKTSDTDPLLKLRAAMATITPEEAGARAVGSSWEARPALARQPVPLSLDMAPAADARSTPAPLPCSLSHPCRRNFPNASPRLRPRPAGSSRRARSLRCRRNPSKPRRCSRTR